ncbi:MAG: YegP family protein [Clostridia bacterium]|nr:YegP family protein [Clostridia bacterium]
MSYLAIGIVALAVLVVLLVILFKIQSEKIKSKKFDNNDKDAVTSLTPEEIDNLSNNVADPDQLLQYINEETEKANANNKKTKNKKAKTSPAKSKVKTENSQNEESSIEFGNEKLENNSNEESTIQPDNKKSKKQSSTKEQKKSSPEVKRQYLGKWKIIKEEDKFRAELIASNGGVLLKTENYTSLSGVKNGIQTIKKNIDNGHFAISVDKYSHFRFKLFSGSNRLICISEDYSSKAKCENGIESVKRFAKDANIIVEDTYETK